jgi:uncharacterized protein (DUF885 family)
MKTLLLPSVAASLWLATLGPTTAQAQPAKVSATVTSAAAKPAASAPLAALLTAYADEHARLFPLEGLDMGDNRYNDQLPNDQTHAFRAQQQRSYQHYLGALRQLDRARLSADDRINYDIFEFELTNRLDGLNQNTWLMPFAQFYSTPTVLPMLGAGTGAQPFKTVRDYDNWLARVHAFPVWADSAIANFRAGMKAGVVLPKALVLKTIP